MNKAPESGQVYFVHPSAWSSLEWEEEVAVNHADDAKIHITQIDGVPRDQVLRERHGSSTFDEYGNLLMASVATTGGVTTALSATYEIREPDWLISLRQSELVSASDATGSPPVLPRHRDYEHDARGLLCHVWIEKDDPDPAMQEVLTFAHDDEGLVRAITASAAGEPSRTVHYAYEPSERVYKDEQWNDLGEATWFLTDPALGAMLATEDASGVITQAQVDDLGRTRHVQREGAGSVDVDYAPRIGPSGGIVGMSVSTTEEGGFAVRSDLDVLGREVGRGHVGFDGSWIEQTTTYDALGRVVAVSRPGKRRSWDGSNSTPLTR